jgi:putative glutamine transport system substrate-binding protein
MKTFHPKTCVALMLASLALAAPLHALANPAAPVAAKAADTAGADTLGTVRKRGKLVVGNKLKFVNFNAKNPATGQYEGYMADIARALAKRLLGDENKVEFRQTTDETRFEMMANGDVDVLIDLTPSSAEKEKFVDFSEEIFRSGSALLVKKGSPIKGLNSIRKGTRVIYVRDNVDIALIKMKAPLATYIEFENSADAFAALKAGQGDVFTQVVTHLFRAASQDPAYTVLGRFTDKPYYVAVKEGDLVMRDAVDEALRAIKASGEYDRLYQKWFAPLGGNAPGMAQAASL